MLRINIDNRQTKQIKSLLKRLKEICNPVYRAVDHEIITDLISPDSNLQTELESNGAVVYWSTGLGR